MISFVQSRRHPPPQWHHLRLDAPQLAQREHERIKMLFSRTYMSAHRPRGMTLWMAANDGGGADMYVWPREAALAEQLIRRYQAHVCGPPPSSMVLVAGDGYDERAHATNRVGPRTTRTTRSFLPACYPCRTVRALEQHMQAQSLPYNNSQLAPFVRRFACAWKLESPHPRSEFAP